jgi:tetratricopeptide (TPR) repeat protein
MTFEEFRRQRRAGLLRLLLPVFGGLAAILLLVWFFTRMPDRRDFLNEAQEHYRSGRYAQAISALDRVISEDPKNTEAYRIRARAYVAAGQDIEARKDLDRLIALLPEDQDARGQRAHLLLVNGRYAEAVADFSKMIELHPTADAYAGRGVCLRETGRTQEAIADLVRASAADRQANYFVQLAEAYKAAGNDQLAIQSFTTAIDINPVVPYLYRSRALLWEKMGNRAAAEADRKKADELESRKRLPS